MTLTVTLSPEYEDQLLAEASRLGVAPQEYAQRLLEHQLRRSRANAQAVALIQEWINVESAAEQQATGTYLIQALDTDRPSDRKLFPAELEGNTW
jgi:serine/threonine protein kinase HipA of HipAB toxin-antitoxin module